MSTRKRKKAISHCQFTMEYKDAKRCEHSQVNNSKVSYYLTSNRWNISCSENRKSFISRQNEKNKLCLKQHNIQEISSLNQFFKGVINKLSLICTPLKVEMKFNCINSTNSNNSNNDVSTPKIISISA